MLAKLRASAKSTFFAESREGCEEILEVAEESSRLKSLYRSFLILDESLQKYSRTCTAFAEVTGLIQEGMDQLTEQVLSYCSNTQQNGPLQALETDALDLRSSFSSDRMLSQAMSEHLLLPLGARLREFKDLKCRMKERSCLKKQYDKMRKKVGDMRVDRIIDQEELFLAETKLCDLYNKFSELTQWLLHDLQEIHSTRSQVCPSLPCFTPGSHIQHRS